MVVYRLNQSLNLKNFGIVTIFICFLFKAALYGTAAGVVIVIVAMTIMYIVWFYCFKKRPPKGFQKLSTEKHPPPQNIINNGTPKIQLNTVEFTLPQGPHSRSYPWSTHPDDMSLNKDVTGRHDVNISIDTVQDAGIKTTVGLLKPELYNTVNDDDNECDEDLPPGNIGRVWYNLEYDPQSEKLIVTVDRIKNLPGRQQRSSSISLSSTSSCDPFIRLYLLPDEKRYLQSKMKRKTRNPTFKETFMFTMSYNLLIERTLRITVFDVDRFMRQTVIGHTLYPLTNFNITMPTDIWGDIEKSSQISNSVGRLQVGLKYSPHVHRVSVSIIRGQRIGSEEYGCPDSYVKITYSVLNKVQKIKKTSVQKNTSDPFYNQTVEFKIDQQGLDIACLNFEVFHNVSAMVKNDKSLGSFIVGGALCTRGKELEHWTAMTQKPQTVIKEWHDLKS